MSIPSIVIGNQAPAFNKTAVINDKFNDISLEDYKNKYLVILFYPMDFTFVCPTELIAFNDSISQFREINTEVIVVSTDSKYSHLKWNQISRKDGGLGGISLPMVADFDKSMAQDYGVLLTDGEDAGACLRGLFIIDDKGIVRQMSVNDLPVGRSVDETIRLIQAFQFNAKHGEVCPANWKPGKETMKDDPIESLKYFNKVNEPNNELSNKSLFKEIKSKDDLVLDGKSMVLVGATWCHNCKILKNNINNLKDNNQNINYYQVDIEDAPEINEDLDVSNLPTLFIYSNDKIDKTLVGNEALNYNYASI